MKIELQKISLNLFILHKPAWLEGMTELMPV